MIPEALKACQKGHFAGIPSVQAAVYKSGQSKGVYTAGEASTASVFDVASVTKMAATTLVSCRLHAQGRLDLELPLTEVFPETQQTYPGIRVKHLLAHSSGLPAWRPFFSNSIHISGAFPGPPTPDGIAASRAKCREAIFSTLPERRPGEKRVYSDTGFLLLGFLIEHLEQRRLDDLAQELIFKPAQLRSTRFHRLEGPLNVAGILATGHSRPRQPAPGQEGQFSIPNQTKRLDPGEVDDDNAYALGGVAGHAGLFSTADDLARLGGLILEEFEGAKHFNMQESLQLFAQPDRGPEGPLRALGFDLISPQGSSTGERWGQGKKGGLGHLGFTGCALWIDRDRLLSAALLSNRVLPGRDQLDPIREMRPAFFDAIVEADETGLL